MQPVYWEFDHTLCVYPLPDALVLADNAPAASFQFDSCACINPVRARATACCLAEACRDGFPCLLPAPRGWWDRLLEQSNVDFNVQH